MVAYRSGFFYKPIQFDSNNFYPDSSSRQILLSSIQAIKLTKRTDLKNVPYGEIIYGANPPETIRILPPTIEDSFAHFIEAVKLANPSVEADRCTFKLYGGFFPGVIWQPNKS